MSPYLEKPAATEEKGIIAIILLSLSFLYFTSVLYCLSLFSINNYLSFILLGKDTQDETPKEDKGGEKQEPLTTHESETKININDPKYLLISFCLVFIFSLFIHYLF